MNVKRRLCEGVAVTTALYEEETCRNREEIKCNEDELSEEYVWSDTYGLIFKDKKESQNNIFRFWFRVVL